MIALKFFCNGTGGIGRIRSWSWLLAFWGVCRVGGVYDRVEQINDPVKSSHLGGGQIQVEVGKAGVKNQGELPQGLGRERQIFQEGVVGGSSLLEYEVCFE